MALLGPRSWAKALTACQGGTEACPQKSQAGLKEIEAMGNIFKEGLTEVKDLEATLEEMEVVAGRQKHRNEQMKVDTIGSLEDRHMDRRLCGFAGG